MKLLIQGMRRSGTTIVYDALRKDSRWDAYYEPLAAARQPEGDELTAIEQQFASVRSAREQFIAQNAGIDWRDLNFGAPKAPELELDEQLPDFVREYLQTLLSHSPDTLIKFTRMAQKLEALSMLAPDAHLVVIVRDPRAVATSYLRGHGGRDAETVATPADFFGRQSDRQAWNFYAFSSAIAEQDGVDTASLRDFERVLLVWRRTVTSALSGAEQFFDGRCSLIRLHEFIADPVGKLTEIYSKLGHACPPSVCDWVTEHVRGGQRMMAPDDGRWTNAFTNLELDDVIGRYELLDRSV